MTGLGAKFGRKKEAAIAALLTQRNIEEAARAVNVSARTLRRWMQLPDFKAEYQQARQDAVMQTNARIQQNSGAAAAVLLRLMADPTTPASVRARNARYILDSGNQSLAKENWEACAVRITALESARQPEPSHVAGAAHSGRKGQPLPEDLMRRTERLERGGLQTSQLQANLRAWGRRMGADEEAFLRAAQGYQQDLRGELGDDGRVTWPTFQLLRDIAGQTRERVEEKMAQTDGDVGPRGGAPRAQAVLRYAVLAEAPSEAAEGRRRRP